MNAGGFWKSPAQSEWHLTCCVHVCIDATMNIQNKVPKEVEPGTGDGKAFNCIKTVQITKKLVRLGFRLTRCYIVIHLKGQNSSSNANCGKGLWSPADCSVDEDSMAMHCWLLAYLAGLSPGREDRGLGSVCRKKRNCKPHRRQTPGQLSQRVGGSWKQGKAGDGASAQMSAQASQTEEWRIHLEL